MTLPLRARIGLLTRNGISHEQVAQGVEATRPIVLFWGKRLACRGLCALDQDALRGEPPPIELPRRWSEPLGTPP